MKTVNLNVMGGSGTETLAAFLSAMSERPSKQHCYDMGYDCGLNGSNSRNCDFRYFLSPDHTRAWEQGNNDAQRKRRRRRVS